MKISEENSSHTAQHADIYDSPSIERECRIREPKCSYMVRLLKEPEETLFAEMLSLVMSTALMIVQLICSRTSHKLG